MGEILLIAGNCVIRVFFFQLLLESFQFTFALVLFYYAL